MLQYFKNISTILVNIIAWYYCTNIAGVMTNNIVTTIRIRVIVTIFWQHLQYCPTFLRGRQDSDDILTRLMATWVYSLLPKQHDNVAKKSPGSIQSLHNIVYTSSILYQPRGPIALQDCTKDVLHPVVLFCLYWYDDKTILTAWRII